MCELSGMFMHHKIIEEFVPNILSYVQKHDNFGAGKKRSLTADEKLFDAIQKWYIAQYKFSYIFRTNLASLLLQRSANCLAK